MIQLELLKVQFSKNHNGAWAIENFLPIPLKPRESEGGDFFAVEDDLVTAQPNFLGTIKFILGQSIVPVVAHVPGESVLRCLGTGFFISCTGLLVTAAHVITDPIERQYGDIAEVDEKALRFNNLKLGVMIPVNSIFQGEGYFFRDIEWASFLGKQSENPLPIAGINLKLTSDTAICKVAPIAETFRINLSLWSSRDWLALE